jgi:hypothetical protein
MRKPQEPGGSQRRHRACKQQPEQVSIRFCSWVQRLCKHHCFKVCSTATARFSALCTLDKWFDYVSQEGVSKTLLFMQAEAGLSCWSLPPQRQTRNMWSNPSLTPISMISLHKNCSWGTQLLQQETFSLTAQFGKWNAWLSCHPMPY